MNIQDIKCKKTKKFEIIKKIFNFYVFTHKIINIRKFIFIYKMNFVKLSVPEIDNKNSKSDKCFLFDFKKNHLFIY